jgi:hypothetical protein
MSHRVLVSVVAIMATGASAPALESGMWETTVQVGAMQIPNLPPELARSLAGQTHTIRNCITAADLQRTPERVFASTKGDCSYSNFSMQAGSVSGTLTCKGGVVSQMSGRYTPTTFETTSKTNIKGGISSTSVARGRRVGSC